MTILERIQSMVLGCNLPKFLWTETINAIDYLINMSPTKTNFGVSLEEFF